MVPGSLYSTDLDGAMRRWLGVFTMTSAHDLCPAADLKRTGLKTPPLQGRQPFPRVGQSDGVAACDTFAGELLGEIADEEIHGTGGGGVIDLGEKFGGEDLGLHHGDSGSKTVGVVGAERRARGAIRGPMIRIDQHVTALGAGVLVVALRIGMLFWGHSEGPPPVRVTGVGGVRIF